MITHQHARPGLPFSGYTLSVLSPDALIFSTLLLLDKRSCPLLPLLCPSLLLPLPLPTQSKDSWYTSTVCGQGLGEYNYGFPILITKHYYLYVVSQ